jgi:hypothetical protein
VCELNVAKEQWFCSVGNMLGSLAFPTVLFPETMYLNLVAQLFKEMNRGLIPLIFQKN